MVLDLVVAAAIGLSVGLWIWRGAPGRRFLLPAAAGLVVIASVWAVFLGRWQAVPAIGLGAVLLAIGLWGVRRPRASGFPWVSGPVFALGGLFALLPLYLMPVFVLPKPTGSFAIGVRDFDLVDASRLGVGASPPTEPRRLLIRTWYPAEPAPGSTPRPYATAAELRSVFPSLARSFGAPGFFFGHIGQIRTHSFPNAPAARPAGERFPVVYFSHGFGSYLAQNTALMEELASHGYVVVSIAHTWDTAAVLFADGDVAIAPPPKPPEPGAEAIPEQQRWLLFSHDNDERYTGLLWQFGARSDPADLFGASARTWLADRLFVARQLTGSTPPESFAEIASVSDFSRVAHTGMSFGGSTSGAACLADPACRAAVNLDGADQHFTPVNSRMTAPFLMLHSDWRTLGRQAGVDAEPDPGKAFNDFSYEPFATAGETPGVVRMRVNDVYHMGLSDMGLMLRSPLRDVLVGRKEGHDLAILLNTFLLDFLDHAVKGVDNSWPAGAFARHAGEAIPHSAANVKEWWASKSPKEQARIVAETDRMAGRTPGP